MRTSILIVWLAAWSVGAQSPSTTGQGSLVSCILAQGAGGPREYRLEQVENAGERVWELAFRGGDAGTRWVRLRLPNAEPHIAPGRATLSYRNANGGRQIELRASEGASTIDVWVDHGLEVNIEADLDPRVDSMNTDGPAAARCSVVMGK